jgi:DNA invertase Pin-like site-specific DNA recombinase
MSNIYFNNQRSEKGTHDTNWIRASQHNRADARPAAGRAAGRGSSLHLREKASGKTADRPELVHCLKALRHGDTLVVWRLDRLGRNLQDLIRIVNDLEERGVKFRSITEAVGTGGSAGKLAFCRSGGVRARAPQTTHSC